jgi:hypothetical protein
VQIPLEVLYSPGNPAAMCRLAQHLGRRLCAPLFRAVCLFRALENVFYLIFYSVKQNATDMPVIFPNDKARIAVICFSLRFPFSSFLNIVPRFSIFPGNHFWLEKSRKEYKIEHFSLNADEFVFILKKFELSRHSD